VTARFIPTRSLIREGREHQSGEATFTVFFPNEPIPRVTAPGWTTITLRSKGRISLANR
jgi:hypothetical protein